MDPIEVKRLLDAYEIPMVPTFAAVDAGEAVVHANAVFAQGATVVLKIMSRDIAHKSDVGGVVLNLTTADAVRKAADEIIARAKSLRPEARIAGVTRSCSPAVTTSRKVEGIWPPVATASASACSAT